MKLYTNINTIQRSLDASSLRQSLINNNIANVDTPGYKTMDISFKEVFAKEKAKSLNTLPFSGYRTDPRHFVIGNPANNSFQPKINIQNTSILNNENNVDIEYEMTKLAENNIWYNSLTQILNKEFSLLKSAIDGRR